MEVKGVLGVATRGTLLGAAALPYEALRAVGNLLAGNVSAVDAADKQTITELYETCLKGKSSLKETELWKFFSSILRKGFSGTLSGLRKTVDGNNSAISVLYKDGYGAFFKALSNPAVNTAAGEAAFTFRNYLGVAIGVGAMPLMSLLGLWLWNSARREFHNQWEGRPEHRVRSKFWHGLRMFSGFGMMVGGAVATILPMTAMGAITPFFSGAAVLGTIGAIVSKVYIDYIRGQNVFRYPEKAPPLISDGIRSFTRAYPSQFNF